MTRAALRAPAWRMMSRFVLRSTGFPFDLLDRLRLPLSAAAAGRLLAAERARAELAATVSHRIGADPVLSRTHRALRKRISRGDSPHPQWIAESPWIVEPRLRDDLTELARLSAARDAVSVTADATLAAELAEARGALRDLAEGPAVQEALWLSNPAVVDNELAAIWRHWDIGDPHRRARVKRWERRLYTYLQRFAAKNDTTSFFGPLNYGRFGTPGTTLGFTADRIQGRRPFVAFRAVRRLAELIAAEPELRGHLRPRRSVRGAAPIDPQASAVRELCDGHHTVRHIAATLDLDGSTMDGVLEKLVEARMVTLGPHLFESTMDPLRHLAAEVDGWPDGPAARRWRAELTALTRSAEAFSATPWPARKAVLGGAQDRFARLTGERDGPGDGAMFRDRTLFYEECRGDVAALDLSADHQRSIVDALAPVLDLCAGYTVAMQEDHRAAGVEIFHRLRRTAYAVPLPKFVAAWRRAHPTAPPTPRADRVLKDLVDLVGRRATGAVCRLAVDEVRAITPPCADGLVGSPDLMLAASDMDALAAGDFRLVLGELHHGAQPVGWMLTLADDPDGWAAELAGHLPRGEAQRANLVFRRRMKVAPPEFPGVSVQAGGLAAGEALDLADLEVYVDGAIGLRVARTGRAVRFCPPSFGVPDDGFAVFDCFSFPLLRMPKVRLGGHTPRVEVGGVVVQRRRWEVAADRLPGRTGDITAWGMLVEAARLRDALDLPERVFVRSPAEPKPVYIDLTNLFALDLLAHLGAGAERLVFEEMVPGPEELWLRRPDGRYCAELRTVFSRPAR